MELPNIIEKISQDVATFINSHESFKVTDKATQDTCINGLSQIKARLKRIEELRKEFVGPLNEQVKKINNMFKAQSEPLENFEGILKGKLKIYLDEQDRLARIAAEAARKEQEAKEAAERAALAEAARKQAEADRLAKEAEQAKGAEQKKLQELAEQAKQANEQAQQAASVAVIEAANETLIVAPSKSVRTEDGMASRKLVWKFEVENLVLTMKAHPELFELNQKAVNQLIQSGERSIAGLRIYQDSIIAIK